MSRSPQEPAEHGLEGAVRWAGYLEWLREDIIEGVLGLPVPERTASRLASGWSPIQLLHMEQRSFVWGFLAEPVPRPWGDWNVEDPSAESTPAGISPAWEVAEGVTAEEIAAALRATGEHTRATLSAHGL